MAMTRQTLTPEQQALVDAIPPGGDRETCGPLIRRALMGGVRIRTLASALGWHHSRVGRWRDPMPLRLEWGLMARVEAETGRPGGEAVRVALEVR